MRSRNIRNITILSDLLLFNAAFAFAYVVRYRWQWLLPVGVAVRKWGASISDIPMCWILSVPNGKMDVCDSLTCHF